MTPSVPGPRCMWIHAHRCITEALSLLFLTSIVVLGVLNHRMRGGGKKSPSLSDAKKQFRLRPDAGV